MAAPGAKFRKRDIIARAFPVFFGRFVLLLNSLQNRVFYDARIRLLLVNWCRHSVEPRALTCPFKQSNLVAWSLLSWHTTQTHLWGRRSVFSKLLVSTVTVTPSHWDYVNRSASQAPTGTFISITKTSSKRSCTRHCWKNVVCRRSGQSSCTGGRTQMRLRLQQKQVDLWPVLSV